MKYSLECATWELTLRCNLKCFHCEFSAGNALPDELTTKESLDLVDQLKNVNCKKIILMGGEPFLRSDWDIISKKIKDVGIKLAFISNGYLDSKRTFNKLENLNPEFIGVSIDGGTAKTHDKIRGVEGSFSRALNFIDRCIKLEIPVIVITSIHKLNFEELPILRDLLFNKDVSWTIQVTDIAGRFPKEYLIDENEFYSIGKFIFETQKKHPMGSKFINGAHDIGYNSKYFPNLTSFPNWIGCQAGISLIGIESNGRIKGCSALTSEFVEVNVRDRSIADIWNDPESFPYNRCFKKEDLNGFCKSCEYGKTCKGGCTMTSYMSTGNLHGDPFCFHKIEKKMKK
jgi:radical SAM protein with 4Fe4S-binding SPASM domain